MTEAAAAPAPARAEAPDAAGVAFDRVRRRVRLQTWVIAALAVIFVGLLPLTQNLDIYLARMPDGKTLRLTALDIPNMTNRAVLAWSTSTIAEMLTIGFGDLNTKLPRQKWRFTPKGWDAYIKAFDNARISQIFKQNQMVLATVPSNTPVIIGQGLDLEGRYSWTVQMPVIMTYATTDNITREQRSIVTMILVRVPLEESPAGLAIDSWVMRSS